MEGGGGGGDKDGALRDLHFGWRCPACRHLHAGWSSRPSLAACPCWMLQIEYASEAQKRAAMQAEAKAKAGYFSGWLSWGSATSTPAKIEYLLSVGRDVLRCGSVPQTPSYLLSSLPPPPRPPRPSPHPTPLWNPRGSLLQEDEKAKARARENWDWDMFEKGFAVPRDFVLFEFELLYRNGTIRLDHAPGSGIAELKFGGKFRLSQVRRSGCGVCAGWGAGGPDHARVHPFPRRDVRKAGRRLPHAPPPTTLWSLLPVPAFVVAWAATVYGVMGAVRGHWGAPAGGPCDARHLPAAPAPSASD